MTDSSDPGIRSLMKVPATLADLGIAAAVVWWFRERPKLAVLAAGAVLLWPAVWYVSAWWGQYESIYVLGAVLALLAARARLPLVAAALLAVSLMTKPQALPFLVPFGAWFLATQGWRGTLKAAAVGAVVVVLLWLPFVAAGGPANYLGNLGTYQNDIFGVLSLRAWNPWALLQELGRERRVRLGSQRGLRSRHVPARRLRAGRAVRAGRVRGRVPAPDGRPARARPRGDLAGSVHRAHDDARAVRLPGARVPAVRARSAGHRRRLDRVRDHFLLDLLVAVPPEGWTIPDARAFTIVGSIAMTVIALWVVILLASRGRSRRAEGLALVAVGA